MNDISFIIPYSFEITREPLKNFVVGRISTLYPQAEIILGEYNEKPFSRSRAINNGVKESTKNILIIIDADFCFEKKVIDKAIELVRNDKVNWLIPFDYVYSLEYEETEKLMAKGYNVVLEDLQMQVRKAGHMGLGSMCIIKREKFDYIKGYDENIVGWGYEDNVFTHIANTVLGLYSRITFPLIHLWHPYLQHYKNEELTEKNRLYFNNLLKIKTKEEMLKYIETRYKNE